MDINMKVILIAVFFTASSVFALDLQNVIIKKDNSTFEVDANFERESPIYTLLTDSVVLKDAKKAFAGTPGTDYLGDYIFEIKKDALKSIVLTGDLSSPINIDSDYKLVEIQGKGMYISDGSFVVYFPDSAAKLNFKPSPDYELIFEQPNALTFRSRDFKNLESLLETIENDPTVLKAELDLIDPYIQLQ